MKIKITVNKEVYNLPNVLYFTMLNDMIEIGYIDKGNTQIDFAQSDEIEVQRVNE